MVSLVDLQNPRIVYSGQVFWDMVRPGQRLSIMGPKGCQTSVVKRVVQMGGGSYYIKTRNSSYVLSRGRAVTPAEIGAMPTIAA